MMDENYTPELFSLSDDEGNEYTFEKIDEYEENDTLYVALVPVYDDPKDQLEDSGDLVIMKEVYEEDDSFFEEIENEEEFDHISSIFITRLSEAFDIEQ